jgi:DNA-3-methyladenine glycosylase I
MPAPNALPDGLFADEHAVARCTWCRSTPVYRDYHDTEWGYPVADDRRLFEKICLEGFQSGLSWLTILNKREAFRNGFAQFDIEALAQFGDADVTRLLGDIGIVRHRGKIVSAINNAQQALRLREEFGSLAAYFWSWEPDPASRPAQLTGAAARGLSTSPESVALSRDLKKRGWSFVGPTTVYAFMQAMGLVNDHIEGCSVRVHALEARSNFTPPR